MMSGGTLFEELGYYYVGPVDGHDLVNLVPILENIRDKKDDKPVSQWETRKVKHGSRAEPRVSCGEGGVLP